MSSKCNTASTPNSGTRDKTVEMKHSENASPCNSAKFNMYKSKNDKKDIIKSESKESIIDVKNSNIGGIEVNYLNPSLKIVIPQMKVQMTVTG